MARFGLYVFDAYGTLFDVHSAVARHAAALGPAAQRLSELWRVKQLEYTWTRSLMGSWRDFRACTADALDFAAARCEVALSPKLRSDLLAAYERLDAFADAAPALDALKRAGAKTAILSNGTDAMLASATEAAGLAPHLDAVLSIDACSIFKTAPATYALVGAQFDVAPAEVSFQSSNRWDVAGARRFGFRTTWVNRGGMPDEYTDLPPDLNVRTLDELVQKDV